MNTPPGKPLFFTGGSYTLTLWSSRKYDTTSARSRGLDGFPNSGFSPVESEKLAVNRMTCPWLSAHSLKSTVFCGFGTRWKHDCRESSSEPIPERFGGGGMRGTDGGPGGGGIAEKSAAVRPIPQRELSAEHVHDVADAEFAPVVGVIRALPERVLGRGADADAFGKRLAAAVPAHDFQHLHGVVREEVVEDERPQAGVAGRVVAPRGRLRGREEAKDVPVELQELPPRGFLQMFALLEPPALMHLLRDGVRVLLLIDGADGNASRGGGGSLSSGNASSGPSSTPNSFQTNPRVNASHPNTWYVREKISIGFPTTKSNGLSATPSRLVALILCRI
eukprot:28624-Pelagococcus_subviridis.AAC.2